MAETFSRTFYTRWADLDSNAHMANTAYLDLCVDVRMMFFREHGFDVAEFARLKIGPVVKKDELEYFRELRLLEPVRITLALAAISPDGARFRLRNELFREEGTLAARVTSAGGWLDLVARKLVAPPPALLAALQAMSRTEDFEELPARS